MSCILVEASSVTETQHVLVVYLGPRGRLISLDGTLGNGEEGLDHGVIFRSVN